MLASGNGGWGPSVAVITVVFELGSTSSISLPAPKPVGTMRCDAYSTPLVLSIYRGSCVSLLAEHLVCTLLEGYLPKRHLYPTVRPLFLPIRSRLPIEVIS